MPPLTSATKLKGCCAPARAASAKPHVDEHLPSGETNGSTSGMRLLGDGDFVMGSETEAPIHRVELSPFYMDALCVTNADFNEFANATHYKTDAERFGSAFVFSGHLSSALRAKHGS